MSMSPECKAFPTAKPPVFRCPARWRDSFEDPFYVLVASSADAFKLRCELLDIFAFLGVQDHRPGPILAWGPKLAYRALTISPGVSTWWNPDKLREEPIHRDCHHLGQILRHIRWLEQYRLLDTHQNEISFT